MAYGWGCKERIGGEARNVGPIWEHSCWGEELVVNGAAVGDSWAAVIPSRADRRVNK